jgi:hypothetical protein
MGVPAGLQPIGTDQRKTVWDRHLAVREDQLERHFLHSPIQARRLDGLMAGGGPVESLAQAMPGGFPVVEELGLALFDAQIV